MNAVSALQDSLKTDLELFRARLSSIVIVDIGTIESIDNGRAVVHGSSFVGGQQTVFQDAEVIFPGNGAGVYKADCVGAVCLIFIPRSNMVDTVTRKVRFGSVSFDTDGVKVLPISNGVNDKVRVNRDAAGSQSINTDLYSALFSEGSASISRNDGLASAALDANGNLHVMRQGDNGTYYKDLLDGEIVTTWISKDKDVQWVDTLNSDGSRSLVQSDPRDSQSDPLFSITIAADGTATLGLTKGLSLETKDALVLKGKSVSIESTDGDVGITAKSKATITADDNVDVKSGSGKKFTVNGTNLEVE